MSTTNNGTQRTALNFRRSWSTVQPSPSPLVGEGRGGLLFRYYPWPSIVTNRDIGKCRLRNLYILGCSAPLCIDIDLDHNRRSPARKPETINPAL